MLVLLFILVYHKEIIMSVMLYRPGNTIEVDGIKCDFKLFPPVGWEYGLKQGWYISVKDFPKPEKKVEDPKKESVTKKKKTN